jgi:hypothetical protein
MGPSAFRNILPEPKNSKKKLHRLALEVAIFVLVMFIPSLEAHAWQVYSVSFKYVICM